MQITQLRWAGEEFWQDSCCAHPICIGFGGSNAWLSILTWSADTTELDIDWWSNLKTRVTELIADQLWRRRWTAPGNCSHTLEISRLSLWSHFKIDLMITCRSIRRSFAWILCPNGYFEWILGEDGYVGMIPDAIIVSIVQKRENSIE
jgi:hypothetical protein